MADVRPLRALCYSAGQLDPLLAPPYDILTEAEVEAYRNSSPHNVVRLTRPGSDYAGSAKLFEQWLQEGVLVEDETPAMYIHETQFEGRVRRDLIAAVRLQPYSEQAILPHERTHNKPKEDRLALLRASGVSYEPLWFLASGLNTQLAQAPLGKPESFAYQDEQHRLYRIDQPEWLAAVTASLASTPLLIADGHHRYETTLAYSQEVGGATDAASRYTLALLTDLADPGLVLLPTHRLFKSKVRIRGGEEVGSLTETLEQIEGRVAAGCYQEGKFQVFPLEGEVAVLELHRQIIDNLLGNRPAEDFLSYTRDASEAVRQVDEGKADAAFFLQAPDLTAVLKAAQAGNTMPQKTTYFYPKPPSGMLFHRLDPKESV